MAADHGYRADGVTSVCSTTEFFAEKGALTGDEALPHLTDTQHTHTREGGCQFDGDDGSKPVRLNQIMFD